MARFLVVVPADLPDVFSELTERLSGEDVGVIVDRRRAQRRQRWVATGPVDRRHHERRGQPAGLSPTRFEAPAPTVPR